MTIIIPPLSDFTAGFLAENGSNAHESWIRSAACLHEGHPGIPAYANPQECYCGSDKRSVDMALGTSLPKPVRTDSCSS